MAEEAKVRGNAAFKARDFEAAVRHYSDGINLSQDNHVLYSNRSAAYAALSQNLLALKDAVKTYKLRPDWPRTYVRLGFAHLWLGRLGQAIYSFKLGLEISPDDRDLKSGYEKAMLQARKRVKPVEWLLAGDIFMVPNMWWKLSSDPPNVKIAHQPDFIRMMQKIQKDPFEINKHSDDPALQHALGVLLCVKFRAAKPPDPESLLADSSAPVLPAADERSENGAMRVEKKQRRQIIEEESEDNIDPKKTLEAWIENYITETDLGGDVGMIEKEKRWSAATNLGKLKFEDGTNGYNKLDERVSAFESEDMTKELDGKRSALGKLYKKNGSAVESIKSKLLESECTPDMEQNVQEDEDVEKILVVQLATANRQGQAEFHLYEKGCTDDRNSGEQNPVEVLSNHIMEQPEANPEYPEAMMAAQITNSGDRGPAELLRDHCTERLESNPEDPKLNGNKSAFYMELGAFHEGPESDGHTANKDSEERSPLEILRDYCTERLESNPDDPDMYSSRSACYMKLGSFQEGLKDAEKCIELDPLFWMGYHRKGEILFYLGEYDKAVDTYMLGMKCCPGNEGLLDAFGRCFASIDNTGDLSEFRLGIFELREEQAILL
ncbi:hsp70-Hsp90 organizing protein 1-like [Punica granatum]|uniref:Hsp70-Hsp90 organizing protein 1-like n=1 Tax=Punica granatum TaxID=22663 RepID=A0A6P8DKX0_PUNGR|nr:hsp70-Hsp90 organizing protein 1-like [Punica granatum]